MNQIITSSLRLRQWFICAGFLLFYAGLNAQVSAVATAGTHNGGDFQWKDQATMQQVIQQELAQTNTSLAMPGLTDWSSAMLEAYRSLLTFTQAEMQGKQDMPGVVDRAFTSMQTETVQDPASRAMVMDDMRAKQVELVQKLTFQ